MSTYSLLTIARLLNSRLGQSSLPPLLYLTDCERVPDPLPVIEQLPAGTGVIFRHYDAETKFKTADKIKEISLKNNLLLIVSSDYDLARDIDADGFHLPGYLLHNPPLTARLWRQLPGKLLTAAVHNLNSLQKCMALNVDAALVSPIFKTASHRETSKRRFTLGALGLTRMSKHADLPLYALGGINQKNAMQLLKTPAIGIAGISGIVDNEAH